MIFESRLAASTGIRSSASPDDHRTVSEKSRPEFNEDKISQYDSGLFFSFASLLKEKKPPIFTRFSLERSASKISSVNSY